MLKDDEVYGKGSFIDMGDRHLDTRIWRTPKPDKMAIKFPSTSPFSYAANNPIIFNDPNGEVLKLGGATNLALTDIKSLVPREYRSKIQVVDGEVRIQDFGKLPNSVKNMKGVSLLKNMITSDKNYKYSVDDEAYSKNRTTGETQPIDMVPKDENNNPLPPTAQSAITNLSKTPRSDGANHPKGGSPIGNYDGSVTIRDGEFSRGGGNISRNTAVYHELGENFKRTEGDSPWNTLKGTGLGMDYPDAHSEISKDESQFSREVNGMSDMGNSGEANGFKPKN